MHILSQAADCRLKPTAKHFYLHIMDFATIGACGGQKSKRAPKAVSQNNGQEAEQKGLGNLKMERKPLARGAVKLQPAGSGCWSQPNSCFYAPSI